MPLAHLVTRPAHGSTVPHSPEALVFRNVRQGHTRAVSHSRNSLDSRGVTRSGDAGKDPQKRLRKGILAEAEGTGPELLSGSTRRPRLQQLLFAEDKGIDVVRGQFDTVPMGDGVRGTRLHAISAKNAPGIVDVIGLGVPFTRRNPLRFGVFRSLDIDTVRGARCGAQETGHAFFETVLVALQNVNAPIARLHAGRNLWKILGGGFAEHGPQRDAKPFAQRHKGFAHFPDDRCHRTATLAKSSEAGKFVSRLVTSSCVCK